MKRSIILFAAALFAVVGWSQTMTINFKDGSVVNQNASNITSFEITDNNQSDNGENQGGDDNQGGDNSQNENPSNGKFTIARKTFNGSELKNEYLYEPDKVYLRNARFKTKDAQPHLDREFFIWYKEGHIEIIYRFKQYGVVYSPTEFKKGFNDFGYESVDIDYTPSYEKWESKPFSGSAVVVENDGEYITLEFDDYKIFCERDTEKQDYEELTLNGRLSFKINVEEDYNYTNPCPDDNHPHAIDLGIGTKWSCCNVGAKAPGGFGYNYPWGVTTDKHDYIWKTRSESWHYSIETCRMNNYPYYDQSSNRYVNIGNDISGTQYDVAYTKWGENWRMPSEKDFQNLIDNCEIDVVSLNGESCYRIKGPNGNRIYLPHTHGENNSVLINHRFTNSGFTGTYWTSTLANINKGRACTVEFKSKVEEGEKYAYIWKDSQCYCAYPVRPIYSK